MTTKSNNYQLVCGMEIHAELKTASKMFCGCQNDPFHAPEPNCYTCPTCLGLPGALPVPNQKAIEWTIKLGLALHCQVNLLSKFDRKHYFYPDLPKGYQISQYDIPFCVNGYIETPQSRVRIQRIHLEEDTGKLLHTTIDGQKVSLIDFNRSGVPLIEIVTEPDIFSSQQAADYAKAMRDLIRYLDIGDCDMEQGGMRLEANTSVRLEGTKELPKYKVELKNINSFRFVQNAIEYEVARQTEVLKSGQTPAQETRGWNSDKNISFVQRSKEEAQDYRYFPDPDIPPIELTHDQVDNWQKELPQLPAAVVNNWHQTCGIEPRFGHLLISTQKTTIWLNQLFELAKKQSQDANKLASMMVNGKLQYTTKDQPAQVLSKFQTQTAKTEVDPNQIQAVVKIVLAENPTETQRYKKGEAKLLGFFLGQVRRQLPGNVDVDQIIQAINQNI